MDERHVNLKELCASIPLRSSEGIGDQSVSGIVADSRQIQPGNLFVAIPGNVTDGHIYIPDAVAKGAVAVVGTKDIHDLNVPYIRVENSKRILAHLAAAFYGFPAKKLTVIGVTGTDGKTTTCNIIFEILRNAGLQTGLISTINAIIGDQSLDTGFHVTTPDAPDIQLYLARMVDSGLTHVVLEATSHGLAQYRVEACEFDIAVVTNITHEHLDYHGTFEKYREDKLKLLDYLISDDEIPAGLTRSAVINHDDSSYPYLLQKSAVHKISYGFHREADVRAENLSHDPGGWAFDVVIEGVRNHVITNLIGSFNIYNCLAAIAATVKAMDVNINHAVTALSSFHGVPGRMEAIDLGQDFLAIVDFAHTPNALKSALEAARNLTDGKIITVFGSAGLRDREKRKLMAEVSIQLSDYSVFTAEDPRTEPLDMILEEMAIGAHTKGGREGKNYWLIRDRGAAIKFALKLANKGDLVIVCGKGHEQSMCFGQTEYLWDDRLALKAALSIFLNIAGPDIPYLPTQDPNYLG